jgi:hypothetical protein
MSARRLTIAVSAVILLAGLIGLLLPVSVPDSSGGVIRCGNAAIADLSAARSANDKTLANIPVLNQFIPHNDYVAECQSALSSERGWAIPVAVIGLIGIVGALVARTRERDDSRGAALPAQDRSVKPFDLFTPGVRGSQRETKTAHTGKEPHKAGAHRTL